MKDKMTLLIGLQDCDNQIRTIMARKNQGPLRLQSLKRELEAVEKTFQEEQGRLESIQKERRKIEDEILELTGKIEKSNTKLSGIKSNKEYKAALKEVEDLKRIKAQTEDKAIQIMEEVETLEKKGLENKKKESLLREAFEKDRARISRELKDLDRELSQIEEKRDDFHQRIDQELLKRYLFLRERKDGQAVSAVIGGVCQTCHMGIPPQKFNELLKGVALLTCPHCNRMIYWGEDDSFKQADAGNPIP